MTNTHQPRDEAQCNRFEYLIDQAVVEGQVHDDIETAFLHRHSQDCESCAALYALVGSLRDERPCRDPASRKAIAQLVETGFERRKQRKMRRTLLAMAAGLLLLGFGTTMAIHWMTRSAGTPLRIELASGTVRLQDRTLRKGGALTQIGESLVAGPDRAILAANGVMRMAAEQKTVFQMVENRSDTVKLRLFKGKLAIHLLPDARVALEVLVPDGTVSVTGTVFVVEVDQAQRATVSVVRGSVRVRCKKWTDGAAERLEAGWSLDLPARKRDRATASPLIALLDAAIPDLPEASSQVETLFEPAAPSDLEGAPVEAGKSNEPTQSKTSRPPAQQRLTPDQLLQQADDCRSHQDWQGAAAAYRKLIKQYPNRPAAGTALVPLAQITLDNLNRPEQALRYFQRYSSEHPKGPLGPEALRGECNSLRRLDRPDEERRCLRRFVQKFPQNRYAPLARKRLEEL